MDILPICALAIAGAVLSLFLSGGEKPYAKVIGLIVAIIILFMILQKVAVFIDLVALMEEKTSISSVYINMLLKMTGITIVCELTSDLCIQSDSPVSAKQIRTFGRFCILAVGYPLIVELMELVDSFLG